MKKGKIIVEREALYKNFWTTPVTEIAKLCRKMNFPFPGQDIYWTENTSKNVLTLITCFPFDFIGKAEERFIVRCEKINPET